MENFDFQAGGVYGATYYPSLKSIGEALITNTGGGGQAYYYHYEPGNMTRYEVVFCEYTDTYDNQIVLMSIVNPRRATMMIPLVRHEWGLHDIAYMKEKLGMGEGDCYALIPLINFHLKAMGYIK